MTQIAIGTAVFVGTHLVFRYAVGTDRLPDRFGMPTGSRTLPAVVIVSLVFSSLSGCRIVRSPKLA